MSRVVQAHLALLCVNLLFGFNYHVVKSVVPDVLGPSGFILVRAIGANILLWLVWLKNREVIRDRRDIMRIAVCALFGVCANQLLFFNGLAHTSALNASLLMVSSPVLVLFMSTIILKEKITSTKFLGIILGASGSIGLILLSDKGGGAESSVFGNLLVFINALAYSIYLVLIKPLMTKYRPITVIAYVFLFGMFWVLPFGWSQFSAIEWSALTQNNWSAIGYVVVGTTFLVYYLNGFALGVLSPTITSAYIYLQPFVAGISAVILANYFDGAPSTITLQKLALGAVIFLGVYLVSKPKKDPKIS